MRNRLISGNAPKMKDYRKKQFSGNSCRPRSVPDFCNCDIIHPHRGSLAAITEIHLNSFPSSAITWLGSRAVRCYYQWLFEGPHQMVALGAFHCGRMVGYSFGGVFNGAFNGYVRKYWQVLVLSGITHPRAFVNREIRRRIWSLTSRFLEIRRRNRVIRPQSLGRNLKNFTLLAFAVDPCMQGNGIGRFLMHATEERARESGFDRMNLSVRLENERAVGFYQAVGWKKVSVGGAEWCGQMAKALQITE